MEEVEDEPLFCERVAGIDIGKQLGSASRSGCPATPAGAAGSRRRGSSAPPAARLLELADWLRCWQVQRAGMEATGDYWKPVYFLLEREGFDCLLYHAVAGQGAARAAEDRPAGLRVAGEDHRAAARWRPASCRRRTSAGCAPTPGTGGT